MGAIYTDKTSGAQFLIECGTDHAGGDLKMVYVDSFASCIQTCAQTTGCVDVSLSGTACYMKKSVGSVVKSGGILGAKLIPANSATANVNVAQKSASVKSSSTSQKTTSTMKTSTKPTTSTKATT